MIMDSPILRASANFSQKINFKGSEHEYTAKVVAQDVTVNCCSGTHNHGSSKVKLTNVVDYQWESKYYTGQLIAIHVSGKIFAYAIKGKSGGMIRLAKTDTNQRALIKDIEGLVLDVAFAFTSAQILLACADEEGNLYVYNIEDSDTIKCTLILHVRHPISLYSSLPAYRVIWCPYIPSYDENPDTIDDPAKLLVFLNGNKAEIWDVSVITDHYISAALEPGEHLEGKGYVDISGHQMDIIDASFSPDGTAIATASLDGFVKFFQVYTVDNDKPRCLHQWNPHEGQPLSSLFFLDNINAFTPDCTFWKFAVTGAHRNSEIKLWSCENWTCLQSIHFTPNPISPIPDLTFKVCMDISGHYLLFSDINNRILYVLQVRKNVAEKIACIDSISEFLLPSPFISFCIADTNASNLTYSNSTEEVYREDNEDSEEEGNSKTIAISMYTVQPKRLQECTVTFKQDFSEPINFETSYVAKLNDSIDKLNVAEESTKDAEEIANLDDLQSTVSILLQQQPPLTLKTPNDFNSPIINSSPIVSSPLKNSETENLIDFQHNAAPNSGGSSPSREVQEILSCNNATFNTPQEFFDNLAKLNEDAITESETDTKPTEVIWPNIPTIEELKLMKEDNRPMKEDNHRKEDTDLTDNIWNKAQLQALNYRVSNLESLIREQTTTIQKLQSSLTSQKDDYDLRCLISREFEVASAKSHAQTAKLLEKYLKEQRRVEWSQMENLVSEIMNSVCEKINGSLQVVIANEIKNTVLPPIMGTFDNLSHKLDLHYSQKVNTIDQLLKTNIAKLVNSKQVTESLSSTIISVIKPSLEACYKDMISSTLIPSWEKVCNTMFLQIHNTFTQGTKEYTSSVESYMDRQRRVQDKGKDLIVQMQGVSDSMKNSTEKLTSHLSQEIQKHFQTAFSNMQETLKITITEHVREQIKMGFKTHAAALEDSVVNAVRSRAVTPSPHVVDTQVHLAQIQSLIATGNIDLAFQQALSASATASDLTLVLYICEKVNPQDVFQAGNCTLQQHVLLSLIQQLGADLTRHTEIKLRYLEEGILSLDPKNSITREHLPIVLRELSKQLHHYVTNNANSKYIKSMRMLQMATQSVLKS